MENEDSIITDPLGHAVHLPRELCLLVPEVEGEVYDELATVIEKPAVLIRLTNLPTELIYYRSIGWNNTLLIKVRDTGKSWLAYSCARNPDIAQLAQLIKQGEQLI
jgi:hypothetical protein